MKTTAIPTTLTINDVELPIFFGAIKPDWIATAERKGFSFLSRVADRYHFALRCKACGAITKTNRFTLMTSQPSCHACTEQAWTEDAKAAGIKFLRRDTTNRHYGIFLSPCGHQIRRQFALLKRAATGETGVRCEICQANTETEEAQRRGWEKLGSDPDGNPNYRSYRHTACGHEQRVARVNMQSGRFVCGGCAKEWPAASSYLYAMEFTLANGRELIKLGFSRDPESRLRHQLRRIPEMPCSVLRLVAVPTGREAILLEKRLHAKLRRKHGHYVIDPAIYREQIRVKSEVYDARLTTTILDLLDRVASDLSREAA
ncbi:MAG: GIY-YIG nuclease family protein [Pelagibaca sp.]